MIGLRTLVLALALAALSAGAFAQAKAPLAPTTPPPLSLSDPDGQDLVLEELTVRAAVSGMLSLTEMEMRFRNPHGRRMEGRFTCVLPEGAAISRFAKEVNGRLMEGEVVERLKAHRVYDEILHQMRDPALLEVDQGNRFSARVFPIEANSTVRLVLSYTRLLPLEGGVRTWSLPLRGLPTMARFAFRGQFSALPGEEGEETAPGGARLSGPKNARTSTVQVLEMNEAGFTPDKDIEVRFRPAGAAPGTRVLRAGDFYLAAFSPRVPAAPPSPGPGRWTFVIDTSASSAESQRHRIAALEALIKALHAADTVDLIAFDQKVVDLGSGPAGKMAAAVGPALSERRFLGGTDLEAALKAIADRAARVQGTRFVLVTDGVATLGKTDRKDLLAVASALPAGVTLHALVLGSRQDSDTLRDLTRGRGRVVVVPFTDRLKDAALNAAGALALPLGAAYMIEDREAEWVFPRSAYDHQPGAEVIAIGKLKPGGRPGARIVRDGQIVLDAGGTSEPLPLGAFEPLLGREGYRSYLAYLSDREATEPDEAIRKALGTEQIKVSVEHRVLCPRTTLLVLETEEDYRRFGLDRRALADILTVGPSGIERLDRSTVGPLEPVRTAVEPPPRSPVMPVTTARLQKKVSPAKAGAKGEAGFADTTVIDFDEGGKDKSKESKEEEKAEAGEAFAAPVEAPAPRPAPAAPPAEPGARDESSGREVATELRVDALRQDVRRARVRVEGLHESVMTSDPNAARPITPVEKRGPPEWTRVAKPSAADVEALQAQSKAEPLRRDLYNRLSDALLAREEWKALRDLAWRWQECDPENPQVYESLGEAALRLGAGEEAARAFASLIEVAPGKSELVQRAGLLLLRAGEARLAEVPLRKALELRPDRVNGYRHLALLLWRQGRHEEAAGVFEDALRREFPNWYGDVHRVVAEELAYVYRDWIARSPDRRGQVEERARRSGVDLSRADALRITLAWETDANDVDIHVVDPNGEECFYSHKNNASGLELYQDITQGFGPEVVRTSTVVKGEYHVGVNYFSSGPMGVSRGILVLVRSDGKDRSPRVDILPFRLVEGGRDMRHLAVIKVD